MPDAGQAGTLIVGIQLSLERGMEILCPVSGRIPVNLSALDLRAGLFEHVVHASARQRAHAEADVARIAHGVELYHRRIDPTVDRDVGRIPG